MPALHGAHMRSVVDEPAVCCPSPIGQCLHASHKFESSVRVSPLTLALNVPPAHVVHSRLLFNVAALLVYSPAAQGASTAWHASPLSTAENDVPNTQGVHVRSAEAVPALC